MTSHSTIIKSRPAICAMALCLANLLALASPPPQDGSHKISQDGSRKIWDPNLVKSKTPPKQPGKRPSSGKVTGKYTTKNPAVPTENVVDDTVIGVTIWRLREPKATDSERLLTHENGKTKEYTPERIEADAPLSQGDRIRLTIEAARKGYLYVIDREVYTDGTTSDPYLIFPTTRIHGGKNQVEVGRIIEIPDQEDNPNYFNLKPIGSNPRLAGELLTVIVTPAPIQNLRLSTGAIKLPGELVAEWEKKWGGQTGRLELEGGKGEGWTKAEKEAGKSGARLLTHEEARPQTIYYNPDKKSGDPMLITLRLSISK